MAYKRKTYRYKNAVEIEEYHTGRYGAPGQERKGKSKPTPEQMEKVNQRNKEKTCRRKLRKWFREEDPYVTLTYARQERPPDMGTAKKQFEKFIDCVRKEYRKRGAVLRWIRNIEVGTKNAWHIHMILNRIPDTDLIVARAWAHGLVEMIPCNKKGDVRKLAAYLTKTPRTDPRLREASYSASRNLPLPKPEERIVRRWETWEEGIVRIPKGFYLDKESYHEGINPVTGFKYREYTLLRMTQEGGKNADRRHLHRDKPAGARKGKGKGDLPDERKKGGRDAPRAAAADRGV